MDGSETNLGSPSPTGPLTARRWTRHFFYRAERRRTTWKFRIGLVALVVALIWLSRGWWSVAIATSLICEANGRPSDAILVENFDAEYLLFERAARLRQGTTSRVLVPVPKSRGATTPQPVPLAVAELMATLARVGAIDIVPVQEVEPISLNAAKDILTFVETHRIRSVVVVAPLFRSKRSALVYSATLGAAGVTVTCAPVEGTRSAHTWTETWHGVQTVAEQWLKLQYYKWYVLPFRRQ